MIAWSLILEASLITAAAVGATALAARWGPGPLVAAAAGSFLLILAWRAVANAVHLNDDIVTLVSVGDLGCLLAGAAAPALVARARGGVPRALLPVLAGGLVGSVINVVIL